MPGMNRNNGQRLSTAEQQIQALNTLIQTPVGSRVKRRNYGTVVPHLIDQPLNNATVLRMYSAVASAINYWLPAIKLLSIALLRNADGGVYLELSVAINGATTNTQINVNRASV